MMWFDIIVVSVIVVMMIMDVVDEKLFKNDKIVSLFCFLVKGMVSMNRLGFDFVGISCNFIMVIGMINRFIVSKYRGNVYEVVSRCFLFEFLMISI